ncbi:MAG: F0F1 ATP synthase subunit epsilon [Desulfuromonadales bacterium]|nr:F0F1 ATP synthase subunit epsilon [Desulfuromonadales bacterium]
MKLKIFLPTRIFLETEVTSVTATALNGSFGLRPNHIDFVSVLTPGLLVYRATDDSEERFVAIDRGVLIKQGHEVRVSVRGAISDAPLEELLDVVEERFAELDEQERQVQTAVARLEADFLRRFMQI